jgi:hypothetical protein
LGLRVFEAVHTLSASVTLHVTVTCGECSVSAKAFSHGLFLPLLWLARGLSCTDVPQINAERASSVAGRGLQCGASRRSRCKSGTSVRFIVPGRNQIVVASCNKSRRVQAIRDCSVARATTSNVNAAALHMRHLENITHVRQAAYFAHQRCAEKDRRGASLAH